MDTSLTTMAVSKSITLLASQYDCESALSVSNATNMYTECSSTTYATISNSQSGTTARYLWVSGFDLSSIPSSATITSITARVRGRYSGATTTATYAPRMVSYYYDDDKEDWDVTYLPGAVATSNFGTSAVYVNIPSGTTPGADIIALGRQFGIQLTLRKSSSTGTGRLYVYGVELHISYTIPELKEKVLVKDDKDGWIQPTAVWVKQEDGWVKEGNLLGKTNSGWL